jgi:hypothetical protein
VRLASKKGANCKIFGLSGVGMRDKNILELALLVPFFGDFFGQAKKLQKLG